ncbi:hypothetical protein BJX64DRAFT_186946 [Aspergillus heterothallicus]
MVSAGRFCTLIRMEPAQLSSAEKDFPGPSLQRTDQNNFLRPPDGARRPLWHLDAGMASLIADPAAQRLRDQNPSFRAIPSHNYVLNFSLSLTPFAFARGHWSPQVHRFQPVNRRRYARLQPATPEYFAISNFTRRDGQFRLLSAPAISVGRLSFEKVLRRRILFYRCFPG